MSWVEYKTMLTWGQDDLIMNHYRDKMIKEHDEKEKYFVGFHDIHKGWFWSWVYANEFDKLQKELLLDLF